MNKKKTSHNSVKNAKKLTTNKHSKVVKDIGEDQDDDEKKAKNAFGETLLDRLFWALLIPHPHEYIRGQQPVPHILPSSCYMETVVARLDAFKGAISEVGGRKILSLKLTTDKLVCSASSGSNRFIDMFPKSSKLNASSSKSVPKQHCSPF